MRLTSRPRNLHLLDLKDLKPVKTVIKHVYQDITRVLNGKVAFGSPLDASKGLQGNVDGVWPGTANKSGYTFQSPSTANVEFLVTHNLGRVPTGYDVKSQDQAGIIYDSRRTSWNNKVMFLKCSVASMNFVLFVH